MENKEILMLFGIIGVIVYFLFLQPAVPREGIVINAYDSEGNLIKEISLSRGDLQAVVAETEPIIQLPPNTATIKFDITIENTGDIPLQATYLSGLLEQV